MSDEWYRSRGPGVSFRLSVMFDGITSLNNDQSAQRLLMGSVEREGDARASVGGAEVRRCWWAVA